MVTLFDPSRFAHVQFGRAQDQRRDHCGNKRVATPRRPSNPESVDWVDRSAERAALGLGPEIERGSGDTGHPRPPDCMRVGRFLTRSNLSLIPDPWRSANRCGETTLWIDGTARRGSPDE
ncbi:hypothetical protein AS032_30840 [Rhodococcus qingshengii]|nr:hypothetical protein AOT96_32655 [Rhodococcus sp. 008]KSU68380.1 hypothetical protein AS032_30840 [Rhodococcus qingshengii]